MTHEKPLKQLQQLGSRLTAVGILSRSKRDNQFTTWILKGHLAKMVFDAL